MEGNNEHPIFGESMVLVNSKKGTDLINILRDTDGVIIRKAISLKDVIISNNRLIIQGFSPSKYEKNKFLKSINSKTIKELREAVNKYSTRKYVITRKIYEKVQVMRALIENEF